MHMLARCSSALLVALIVTFLAGALWIAYRVVISGLSDPSITVAALLATVAGLFLTAQRQIADRQESTSHFYLEQYQAGFDKAYDILKYATPGDPLFRMQWIAAARVLATARRLYARITVRAHRYVAEMEIPHQSQRFMPFFEQSAAYYYGVATLPVLTEESLDQAARQSTQRSGNTISTLRLLPETAIHTVWKAVEYPKGYKDVLGDKFGEGERLFLPKGLQAYLDHRDRYDTAAGQLHERAPGERRE
jgi:hypothetical protein